MRPCCCCSCRRRRRRPRPRRRRHRHRHRHRCRCRCRVCVRACVRACVGPEIRRSGSVVTPPPAPCTALRDCERAGERALPPPKNSERPGARPRRCPDSIACRPTHHRRTWGRRRPSAEASRRALEAGSWVWGGPRGRCGAVRCGEGAREEAEECTRRRPGRL